MTLFGWVYLVFTIIGSIIIIHEIGKPREPRTAVDASVTLLISGLLFWGLYVWGIR